MASQFPDVLYIYDDLPEDELIEHQQRYAAGRQAEADDVKRRLAKVHHWCG